jgi:hypothetical protein
MRTTQEEPLRLEVAVEKAAKWLFSHQDVGGGWAQHSGRRPNVLNTAEAVIALLSVDTAEAGDARVQKGVQFLLQHQHADGYWCREVPTDEGGTVAGPDVLRTAMVIQALRKAGKGSDEPPTKRAVRWLVGVQRADGGWGYSPLVDESSVLATCASLEALIGVDSIDCGQCVDRGVNYLSKARHEDGSFGANTLVQGPATVSVVRTLQRLRKAGRPVPEDLEGDAIEWMFHNKDAVLRPIEQEIVLDPREPRLTYSFLHSPATSVIVALSGARNEGPARTELFTQALRAIGDRVNRSSGGVFGDRVLSWSTARGALALWEAAKHQEEIPLRSPEPTTGSSITPAQKAMLGTLILFLGVVVALSISGAFGALQAAIVAAFLLALMVIFGFLDSDQFERLFARLSSFGGSQDGGRPT